MASLIRPLLLTIVEVVDEPSTSRFGAEKGQFLTRLFSSSHCSIRGAKSQSVFVEEWLRQHPQIAEELNWMNDPGFAPPVAQYEQLMDLLLAFYSPGSGERPTLQRALLIAQKTILRFYKCPAQEIQEQMAAAMKEFWLQEPQKHLGQHSARGENLEDVMLSITAFARYYYEVIFLEMAKGERKLLQHCFRSLVRGCEAVYQERLHAALQHNDGEWA